MVAATDLGMAAPVSIRWGDHLVVTGDVMPVPAEGTARLQFIAGRDHLRQGTDLAVRGTLLLSDGSSTSLLRTWWEEELPSAVEYRYVSQDLRLFTCNVYQVERSETVNDWRWGDYAGMWIEVRSEYERVYHCSHSESSDPDFDDLVYSLTVT